MRAVSDNLAVYRNTSLLCQSGTKYCVAEWPIKLQTIRHFWLEDSRPKWGEVVTWSVVNGTQSVAFSTYTSNQPWASQYVTSQTAISHPNWDPRRVVKFSAITRQKTNASRPHHAMTLMVSVKQYGMRTIHYCFSAPYIVQWFLLLVTYVTECFWED